VVQRHPEAECLVADARALPLASGFFDVVTSQFGIEYAGPEALGEAARMVAGGGLLALLVHCREGLIHRRCRASRDAIAAMQRAEFLSRSRDMFEAAFAALADDGARERYREAGRVLAPAIREVEGILVRYGREVADETIVRVYRDVRDIHARLAHHDAAEVLDWLRRMDEEIAAYHGRMASMCRAAIDEDAFARWCGQCEEQGFAIIRREALRDGDGDTPIAWVLVGRRR
jgi:SAM-dependent methyltransferase